MWGIIQISTRQWMCFSIKESQYNHPVNIIINHNNQTFCEIIVPLTHKSCSASLNSVLNPSVFRLHTHMTRPAAMWQPELGMSTSLSQRQSKLYVYAALCVSVWGGGADSHPRGNPIQRKQQLMQQQQQHAPKHRRDSAHSKVVLFFIFVHLGFALGKSPAGSTFYTW